jgi:hypothetical protein
VRLQIGMVARFQIGIAGRLRGTGPTPSNVRLRKPNLTFQLIYRYDKKVVLVFLGEPREALGLGHLPQDVSEAEFLPPRKLS